MKPASFEYHLPRSIEEMTEMLGRYGAEGRILAGGQSLVPAMNFRLSRPEHVIDINQTKQSPSADQSFFHKERLQSKGVEIQFKLYEK